LIVVPGTSEQITPIHIKLNKSATVVSNLPSRFDIAWLAPQYDFALRNGWDGGKAIGISEKCLSDLRHILINIQFNVHWPEVTPLVRGGLNLLWETDDIYVFLEVRNDGAAHLYYNVHGRKWEAVRSAKDSEIRTRLQGALANLPGSTHLYIKADTQTSSMLTATVA
jgi:hypothetical protein